MKIPTICGVIDRRILINFRVDPEALAQLLPAPFRPKLVGGMGLAGVCLIRLKHVRPRFLPRSLGVSSENAAHRIAVEWVEHGQRREGVFIPRRDTSSRFNALVGGRLFPGLHHHGRFESREHDGRYHVRFDSDDGQSHLLVDGQAAADWPTGSVFGSLAAASEFFESGTHGFSVTARPGVFEALELRCANWSMAPLGIMRIESSFFDDPANFPPGTVEFDSALLMRGIEHRWQSHEPLRCSSGSGCGNLPATAAGSIVSA